MAVRNKLHGNFARIKRKNMDKNELISRYQDCVSPVLGHYNDLEISGAKGSYLFSVDGKKILDFSCGIAVTSLGHCHKAVSKAAKKQIDNLEHICIGVAYYEKYVQLAEKLKQITSEGLDKVFFCQDGSGAIEAAIKLAKYTTKKDGIICFSGGFHGRTYAAMSVTTSKAKYSSGYSLMQNVKVAPYPYCYRCKNDNGECLSPETCSFECLSKTEKIISDSAGNIAAMIIEPIEGEGGYIVPPSGYLNRLRSICDKNGIVLIFDEVQTGIGRTGKMFAYEHFNVVPDILVFAKAIANGFPLGGIIAKKELMDKWTTGAHGGTFGGNPIACAAALAVLNTIEKENLLLKAEKHGQYLKYKLSGLKKKNPVIGDVRGIGMMIGVEFVKADGAGDADITKAIMKACLDEGLLLINCGIHDNVIRFIPAINVSKKQIDHALKIFENVINCVQRK